jgi:hypothetical protein
MLRFADSFDHYLTAEITKKWDVFASGGVVTIGAFGRNGTNGLRIARPDFGVAVSRGAGAQTHIVGFSFNVGSFPSNSLGEVVAFDDGANNQISVLLNTVGKLYVFSHGVQLGIMANPLNTGVPNYIEFKCKIDNSTGTIELRVNGVAVIAASGLDTQNTANATADRLRLGIAANNGGANWDYDDLYWCDSTGAQCNDFLGDIRVQCLRPTGVGATNAFTPSAGANWQNVDDVTPNDDTDYNSSATPGQVDTFATGDLTPTTGTIKAVQTLVYARKDDAGVRTIAPVIRHAGADNVGPNHNIAAGYAYYVDIFEVHPGTGVAFTVADVNGDEFGYKEVA